MTTNHDEYLLPPVSEVVCFLKEVAGKQRQKDGVTVFLSGGFLEVAG